VYLLRVWVSAPKSEKTERRRLAMYLSSFGVAVRITMEFLMVWGKFLDLFLGGG